MNRDKKSLSLLLVVMRNLNFFILFFLTFIMANAQSGILAEGSSRLFLTSAPGLPLAAWKLPVIVLSLFGATLCLLIMKEQSKTACLACLVLELFSVFWISYQLNFVYSGLLLWLLAESLYRFARMNWKVSTILALGFLYLAFEFLVQSYDFGLIPFEHYLSYYQQPTRNLILASKNLFASINTVLFLGFIVLILRYKYNENDRILYLNSELSTRNEQLAEAFVQMETYNKELVSMTQTKERNRLAREIHDTLGHALAGIITGLEACIALIDIAPSATKIQLKSIIEVAKQGVTDVRRSIHALRPDSLEKYDLKSALISSIQEMQQATNAEISYSFEADLSHFEKDEEDVIYRIIQEAMTNSIRHGKASQIQITISQPCGNLQIILNLSKKIHVLDAVSNGEQVLASVEKNHPDIILMDIRMPEMDGVVATRIIKERYPEIKIIILTTFDDDEYVYESIKYGASGYLLKGMSTDELVEAIEKVYNGTAMINEDIASKVVRLFNQMANQNVIISVDEVQVKELKPGEKDVIALVAQGLSNKEISEKLFLSNGTIRNMVSTILGKLNLRDSTQLAIWAIQSGLVKL